MKNVNQNQRLRKRKIFRTVFGVFSLSGIMFTFQACYGTPEDFGQDILISGKVTSAVGQESISGIKVTLTQSGQYAKTANDGTFAMYCEKMDEYNLVFSDTDGTENGQYQTCDTIVKLADQSERITINVGLK